MEELIEERLEERLWLETVEEAMLDDEEDWEDDGFEL